MTQAERIKAREDRAKITNVCERIAFDNQWTDEGLPLGLVLLAWKKEDQELEDQAKVMW